MLGFDLEVTLDQDCGAFVVPNVGFAQSDMRITYDSERSSKPWAVSVFGGGIWHTVVAFDNLDGALEWAVRDSLNRPGGRFKVNLPCGNSFIRPGAVPAEDVMASLDWVYLTHVVGFAALATENDCSERYARRHFLDVISRSPAVELGDVTPIEGMRFWIADLHIPFEGFIRIQDIEAEKDACFAVEGIEIVEGYDCRRAASGEKRSAEIISFRDHVAARQLKAA